VKWNRRSPKWSGLRLTSARPISAKQLVLMILSERNGLHKLHFCNVHIDLNAFAWGCHSEPWRRRGTSQKLTDQRQYISVMLNHFVRSFASYLKRSLCLNDFYGSASSWVRMTVQLDRFGSRR
jgi:hypothetical protein